MHLYVVQVFCLTVKSGKLCLSMLVLPLPVAAGT